jgi:hypothetical protein
MGAYLDRLDKRVSTYLDVLGILSSISGFRRAQHSKFRHTSIYSGFKAYFDKLSKLALRVSTGSTSKIRLNSASSDYFTNFKIIYL